MVMMNLEGWLFNLCLNNWSILHIISLEDKERHIIGRVTRFQLLYDSIGGRHLVEVSPSLLSQVGKAGPSYCFISL